MINFHNKQYQSLDQFRTKIMSDVGSETAIVDKRKLLYVRGLCGLKNLGNTCYMNAIIQCLNSLSFFRRYLSCKTFKNSDGTEFVMKKDGKDTMMLIYYLNQILKSMWQENKEITPKSFKQKIGEYNEIFNGFSQNDSHEVLNLILDTIHEETKKEVIVSYPNMPLSTKKFLEVKNTCCDRLNSNITEQEKARVREYLYNYTKQHINDSIISDAYLYWSKYISKSHSVITDLFTGLFYSKVTCSKCNNITSAFEPFSILSIETAEHGETTLDKSLESFIKEEQLIGDNQYYCEECRQKVDATKRMYIWSSPNILIVQLKRFKTYGAHPIKTNSKVSFPVKNFDIKKYQNELHNEKYTNYNLAAVCNHSGSCMSGHYVAYGVNDINKQWYEFNDDDVYHVDEDKLESELITSKAYILFYQKTGIISEDKSESWINHANLELWSDHIDNNKNYHFM